jgi:quercetin dioxygenase-like cupin family protein
MNVLRAGAKATQKGNGEWFTGQAWMDDIATVAETAGIHVLRVTFEPAARTAWHSHPHGQILHILSGLGRVQKAGEAAIEVRPGDTVTILPGERHWHGAAPAHAVSHLAVHRATPDGNEVTWFEPVSDRDYQT